MADDPMREDEEIGRAADEDVIGGEDEFDDDEDLDEDEEEEEEVDEEK